jgi:hypothetical protein
MDHPSRAHLVARAVLLGAALLGLLLGGGCRGDERPAATVDPHARLSQLLRRGAQPGELTVRERGEVERLVRRLLPPLSGPLQGHRWRVAYDDLPAADFVSIDLMKGPGEEAPRAFWCHLFWRGDRALPASDAWALRVRDWPARGVEGHHLFVRLGNVELRAVADAPDYREPRRLRSVLERFDLAALARL